MASKNGSKEATERDVAVPVQEVKFVMREVGVQAGDAQAFSDYLAYEYSEYKILKVSEYPITNGADFLGFRVWVVLVKDNA